MKLIFASGNKHKVGEIKSKIPTGIEIFSMKEMGFEGDIDETGQTLEVNAKIKSDFIYSLFHENCFADDTGLEIKGLNGAPGVYSARYAGANCSFQDNVDLVLKNLKGTNERSARFRTVIHLHWKNQEFQFEGIVNGTITESPIGEAGFGYDPIFLPRGFKKTFAEMNLSEKNEISHRAIAVNKMIDFLRSEV
jgi:XTP/dITP diphosphohydrolase